MTTSLVDSLYSLASPDFTGRIASNLGEPTANVTRGLQGGMSSILGGLLNKTGDATAMQSIFSTVTNSANDGQVLGNPASLIGGTATSSPVFGLGKQFTSSVFGNRASAVTDVLSRSSGLRAGAVTTLLQIAAPLVLGILGKRVREGGLNAGSFTKLIAGERDSITRAAPPGLSTALGAEERVPGRDYEVPRRERPVAADAAPSSYVVEPEKHRSKVWPVVAALGALALVWAIWPRGRDDRIPSVDTGRSAYSGGEVVTPVPAPPIAPATPGVRLPNGTALIVAETGPEARIVGFLNDPETASKESSWFVLDRMQFETNSDKLSSDSDAPIKDIVTILTAYPAATVRIAGHTDNAGSASANLKLSRDRAASVKKALVAQGIDGNRVTTAGFGSRQPIADNSTEEGRTQNRRIAVLVTKKQ